MGDLMDQLQPQVGRCSSPTGLTSVRFIAVAKHWKSHDSSPEADAMDSVIVRRLEAFVAIRIRGSDLEAQICWYGAPPQYSCSVNRQNGSGLARQDVDLWLKLLWILDVEQDKAEWNRLTVIARTAVCSGQTLVDTLPGRAKWLPAGVG